MSHPEPSSGPIPDTKHIPASNPRSRTGNGHAKTPSPDFLSFPKPPSNIPIDRTLRTRHSTYVLSQPLRHPPSPGYESPSNLRSRTPTRDERGIPTSSRRRQPSQPSTATSLGEDPHPQDSQRTVIQPLPLRERATSSAKSYASSAAGVTSTGPVEEVTPWEVQTSPQFAIAHKPTHAYSISSAKMISTGPIEEVTPWEVQSITRNELPFRSAAPPDKISISSRGRARTGPIEEVTPWEVQPVHNDSRASLGTALSSASFQSSLDDRGDPSVDRTNKAIRKPRPTSMKSIPSTTGGRVLTGPVEEVTPWELHDLHTNNSQLSLDNLSPTSKRNSSHGPFMDSPRDETSQTQENARLHRRSVTQSVHSTHSSKRPAMTGPIEEVTPWELLQGPTDSGIIDRKSTLSNESHNYPPGMVATGSIEDVTPWELPPAHASLKYSNTTDSISSSRQERSYSTSTGPVEEVTPWELEPDQLPKPKIPLQPPMTATGSTEEVTPWELFPPPGSSRPGVNDDSEASLSHSDIADTKTEASTPWVLRHVQTLKPSNGESKSTKHGRSSNFSSQIYLPSSSSPAKTFSEVGLNRQRRSTGGKTSTVSSSIPSNYITHPETSPTTNNFPHLASSPVEPPMPEESVSDLSPGARLNVQNVSNLSTDAKFSTVDRTILKELKRNLNAKAAQFVIKGPTHDIPGGIGFGKKHHPYKWQEVPYPRGYDQDVIDLDVWETVFCQDICESLTWHTFEHPPYKVLDIGCGTGTWIINCARSWKECQFVGLDIVPLHPNFTRVGMSDLASRITWIQSNFLEGLPFPNEEFDFVHIKRIALGVPENKWDSLFEEIIRVMKPGGAFEMIEEDLFFPGKFADSGVEFETEHNIADEVHYDSQNLAKRDLHLTENSPKSGDSPVPPARNAIEPSRSSSSPIIQAVVSENSDKNYSGVKTTDGSISPSTTGHSSGASEQTLAANRLHSFSRPPPTTKTSAIPPNQANKNASRFSHPKFVDSAVSVLSSMGHLPGETGRENSTTIRNSPSSIDTYSTSSQITTDTPQSSQNGDLSPSSLSHGKAVVSDSPSNTMDLPPSNPRDHSILEFLYNEMLSSRFINTAPLSLLSTFLDWHFKDIRTHPPLVYMFPPTTHNHPTKSTPEHTNDHDPDLDDTRDAIVPRRISKQRSDGHAEGVSVSSKTEQLPEESRWMSIQGLLHHSSPYVTYDDTLSFAFSPGGTGGSSGRDSRLPNKTFRIDLQTLNLHLALRVHEILSCSESMWEWVLEQQAELAVQKQAAGTRSRSGSNETSKRQYRISRSKQQTIVAEMSREYFDHLLLNYFFDMQDMIGFDPALRGRLSWSAIRTTLPEDRKAFDGEYKSWEQWIEARRRSSSSHSTNATSQVTIGSIPTAQRNAQSQKQPYTRSSTEDGNKTGSSQDQENNFSANPRSSQHSSRSYTPHKRRISRTVRVFVGWKP